MGVPDGQKGHLSGSRGDLAGRAVRAPAREDPAPGHRGADPHAALHESVGGDDDAGEGQVQARETQQRLEDSAAAGPLRKRPRAGQEAPGGFSSRSLVALQASLRAALASELPSALLARGQLDGEAAHGATTVAAGPASAAAAAAGFEGPDGGELTVAPTGGASSVSPLGETTADTLSAAMAAGSCSGAAPAPLAEASAAVAAAAAAAATVEQPGGGGGTTTTAAADLMFACSQAMERYAPRAAVHLGSGEEREPAAPEDGEEADAAAGPSGGRCVGHWLDEEQRLLQELMAGSLGRDKDGEAAGDGEDNNDDNNDDGRGDASDAGEAALGEAGQDPAGAEAPSAAPPPPPEVAAAALTAHLERVAASLVRRHCTVPTDDLLAAAYGSASRDAVQL